MATMVRTRHRGRAGIQPVDRDLAGVASTFSSRTAPPVRGSSWSPARGTLAEDLAQRLGDAGRLIGFELGGSDADGGPRLQAVARSGPDAEAEAEKAAD